MILALSSGWGLAAAAGAVASYSVLAFSASRLSPRTLRGVLFAAWLLHGLVLTTGLIAEPLRFGFAPALSMTVWLVLSIYAVESQLLPQLGTHWALASLGALAVALTVVFPGSFYHRIASPWLPLHWALGIASYGLFAVAVVHGWLTTRTERAMRLATSCDTGVPLLTLERLTFRFVQAGFVLLTATLLVGWLFAEQLYGLGQVWSWSHKTIFSVLAWLTFAGLLVGRARLGWRGQKAVRLLYLGSGLLLLGYVGSRFVLEVILHRL